MAQLPLSYKGAFGNRKTVTKCAAQFSHNVNIFLRIYLNFSPEFGGRDKKEKQKRSGNSGFEEFPRPLVNYQMEAIRRFNYPYQALEEAVVNAFYHRLSFLSVNYD